MQVALAERVLAVDFSETIQTLLVLASIQVEVAVMLYLSMLFQNSEL